MPQLPTVGVFDDVAVCIPTVRQRAGVLALTLAEWQRFDVTPILQLQPDDWPLVDRSQRRNAEHALRRALAECPDARYVLFSEDDILLAPEIETWMPALKLLHAPATLYLDGRQHYPRSMSPHLAPGMRIPERIIRVRGMPYWWGTLAVLLPRAIAEATLRWESDLHGWDMHLQGFLRRQAIPLFAPLPNLVQHRGVMSSLHVDKGKERSATFGRPSDGSGISPPVGIDWCPHGDWNPDPRVT